MSKSWIVMSPQNAARDPQVGFRREPGIARGDDHLMQIADLASPNRVVNGLGAQDQNDARSQFELAFATPRMACRRSGSRESRLRSIGFSQWTGLPAATACSKRSASNR